ncbi:MAG: hypothetical protein OZ921_14870 [Sorangiineae bacterium]|nr:hypothetical protein [Polyangiaceae bacterium]MEB2323792.1 hypothetical protein [Sorangiineae bacterium]
MLRPWSLLGPLSLALSPLLPACSSSPAPSRGSSVELYPNVRVLDAATLALVDEAPPDLTALGFAKTTSSLAAVRPGDVLLGGIGPKTPSGILLRVLSASSEGGRRVFTTERAAITDAIRKGTITLPHTVLARPGVVTETAPGAHLSSFVPRSPLATGADSLARDFTLGVDSFSVAPGVTASGSLGFGLAVDLSLTIDSKNVEGKLVLSGSESASLAVDALVSTTLDERANVATFYFPPIPIPIGGVPLVITTKLSVELGVKGSASAQAHFSAKQDAKVDVGLSLSAADGVDPILEGAASGAIDPVMATGDAQLDAFAGLTVEAALNATVADAAFQVGADGYVRVAAATASLPCFHATAGVLGRAGVSASVLGITLAETGTSKELGSVPIAEGACESDPALATGWAMALSATDGETEPSLELLPDDSLLVTSNSAGLAGYAARFAPLGQPVWEARIDGSVRLSSAERTADGGAWLVGKNGTMPAVARLDAAGAATEARELVTSDVTLSTVLAARASDGGLILGGSALDGGTFVPWAARLAPSGAVLWAKTYGDVGEPHALAEASDGGALLVGENNGGANARGLVLRLTPTGDPVFARTYGDGRLYGVTSLTAGGFAVTGQTATGTGAIVLRLKDDGELTWGSSYEDTTSTVMDFRGNAIAERDDGLLVAGRRDFGDAADAWLLAVGADGSLGFSRTYGGAASDEFRGVRVASDGAAYAIGETKSFGGTSRLLIARVPPSGALVFGATSGASQKNVSGVMNPLPGAAAAFTPAPKALTLTRQPLTTPGWTFSPVTATRTPLAP